MVKKENEENMEETGTNEKGERGDESYRMNFGAKVLQEAHDIQAEP
jgi:hypothetical protein